MFTTFAVIILLGIVVPNSSVQEPIVRTPFGYLQGLVLKNRFGGNFFAFQSIPYAFPPLKSLRFEAPRSPEPWTGILNATQEPPECVQTSSVATSEVSGQEDCLYLNVYTHYIGPPKEFYPVLVYIHGGALQFGSSRRSEQGPEYLLTEPIVLVTINYRLGAFGFINLGSNIVNPRLVANLGIRDQIFALKWVKSTIAYFGGNPSKVTIAGQSAGGMATHALMLSNSAKGLFNRVISISGNVLDPMVLAKAKTAQTLARKLGFLEEAKTNITEMITKLKLITVEEIQNATYALNWHKPNLQKPAVFGIFIEKPGKYSIFDDYPIKMIQKLKNDKIKFFIGSTNEEGVIFEPSLNVYPQLSDIRSSIPYYLNNQSEVIRRVKEFYNISNEDNVNNPYLWGDIALKYGTYRTVMLHSIKNDVFYYEFSMHRKSLHFVSGLANVSYSGAAHTDDLAYLFSNENTRYEDLDEKEKGNIDEMVQLYSNFVRFGQPFVKAGEGNGRWKPYTYQNHFIMNLTNNGLEAKTLQSNAYRFWDEIYEQYADRNF